MDPDVPSDLDDAENQNVLSSPSTEGNEKKGSDAPENHGNLAPLQLGSKRKRGRPAGKGVDKGKARPKQARKARARIGSKAAKISGNESDDSVSDEENTTKEESKQMEESRGKMDEENSQISKAKARPKPARTTRARIGKKPAKISGDESDDSASHKERTSKEGTKQMEENHEMTYKDTSQIPEIKTEQHSESSEKENMAKQEGERNARYWFSKVPETETSEKQSSENSQKPPEKLEVMTDPVHAMLLDMIPRLGKEKVETSNARIEDEKPEADLNAPQPKKKKVSYKDIAGELLKDW